VIVVGTDPGVRGAIAAIDMRPEGWRMFVSRLPNEVRIINRKRKTRLIDEDVVKLLRWINPTEVTSEAVTASPQMGVTSSFAFGDVFGLIRGAALGVGASLETVRPQKWKADLRVPAPKRLSLARASFLIPALAHRWKLLKEHDLAEAAMITLWAALRHSKAMQPITEWDEAYAYVETLGPPPVQKASRRR
jgi:crossover junction endodeoxyribonuclease RuvC